MLSCKDILHLMPQIFPRTLGFSNSVVLLVDIFGFSALKKNANQACLFEENISVEFIESLQKNRDLYQLCKEERSECRAVLWVDGMPKTL